MILAERVIATLTDRKPRASGDDPEGTKYGRDYAT